MIVRIGILGTADIAFRRFLPALQKCPELEYAGVASRTVEKTARFVEAFGGQAYPSYDALLADSGVDAVYVPLPPALHYKWGRKVLEAGKHLFMEKPFTTSLEETASLLALAEKKNLAVHENYMFLYHSQLVQIKELVLDEAVGELRLIRATFGFPKRIGDDFRYKKSLGGGALLDCGGYPVRLVLELLGENVRVTQARLSQPEGYEVDLFGSAVLENSDGLCAQISFGMDNSYKCELEIWGSKGGVSTDRIFTAPAGFVPTLFISDQDGKQAMELEPDDTFLNSINEFVKLAASKNKKPEYARIKKQAQLVQSLKEVSQAWKNV